MSESGFEAKFTMEGERPRELEVVPFRILCLGDWSAHGEKNPVDRRRPIEVDRDNFDEVMARLDTRLELQLNGWAEPIFLEFKELDDFHPDRIFDSVPVFTELRELRRRLMNRETYNAAAREVRSSFNVSEESDERSDESVEGDVTTSGSVLDAILETPAGGSTHKMQPANTSELGRLVSDLVRPHLVSVDENEQGALLAAVDAASGDLMRRILHDRNFQQLEAAWRGLYLLIRRVETNIELKVFVLDLAHSELCDDLKSVGDLTESTLYRHLVGEAVELAGGEPWAVVVGNYAFRSDTADIAALIRVAKIAAAANAPFISHMRPDVIGVGSLFENPDHRSWDLSDDYDDGKLWSALRGQHEAGFLGMTIPRFLARLPYGTQTEPLERFSFEEFAGTPKHDDYLWSNGGFVAALLLAQTFSEYGWEMSGRFAQDIDRLPMHIYEDSGETIYQPCSEVLLTEAAAERLMEHGLMPLVCFKNTDRVRLTRIQSVSGPITSLKGRWN
ncbi:MAG TPA: type VI secretion system contractile sheath large subunit [Pyrinomonadaceae bacterium]|nr:type VI secretion system contractile sheath large subunit [Pyrinomonadaceae bacterium]